MLISVSLVNKAVRKPSKRISTYVNLPGFATNAEC